MRVLILGTRGIPAQHGGFETFAEHFARYLVRAGHEAVVYCQARPDQQQTEDIWEKIQRVHIPARDGPLGTVLFDLKSVWHASADNGIILTLGYNTGIFSLIYRLKRKINLINMDGIEWQRPKWSRTQRVWLYANERFAAILANHLIADHPAIKDHLAKHTSPDKITVIPYGESAVTAAPSEPLKRYGLDSGGYFLVIARPEPENSILEIVQAFSVQRRNVKLIVLGKFEPTKRPYHAEVMNAASAEVIFPGPIYEREIVVALRFHSLAYIHGHRVGGTNPSLVESMAAGSAVIAHDNIFARWVAGEGAQFFSSATGLSDILSTIIASPALVKAMKTASANRHALLFDQENVMRAYLSLLLSRSRQD